VVLALLPFLPSGSLRFWETSISWAVFMISPAEDTREGDGLVRVAEGHGGKRLWDLGD
jgi:hypothetical protein